MENSPLILFNMKAPRLLTSRRRPLCSERTAWRRGCSPPPVDIAFKPTQRSTSPSSCFVMHIEEQLWGVLKVIHTLITLPASCPLMIYVAGRKTLGWKFQPTRILANVDWSESTFYDNHIWHAAKKRKWEKNNFQNTAEPLFQTFQQTAAIQK